MPATLSADDRRRTRFGRALAASLRELGWTQADLGDSLDMTQGSVSSWTTGYSLPPDVETVFRIEKVLGLDPGHLSRHLGFLPTRQATISAVMADGRLDPEGREVMLDTYRELTEAKRRHPTAHTVKAVQKRRSVA